MYFREFEVPSQNFPGQMHKWRLSQILQEGSLRAKDKLLIDLALAARFIFVYAKGRIFGQFFSIVDSIRSLLNGFLLLIDICIGTPSLLAYDIDKKIREERCRYLVAELICRVKSNVMFLENMLQTVKPIEIIFYSSFFSLNTKTVWNW